MELKAGQKVYLKPVGNAARHSNEIKEAVILKVGRIYFYVGQEGERERLMKKFYIENYREVSDYSANWEISFEKVTEK